MDPTAALSTIAQVAMAVTGFAGLLTVFRQRTRKWRPIEVYAIRFLIVTSISACLFALLPLPMLLADVPQGTVWTICVGVLGAWLVALMVGQEIIRQKLELRPRWPFAYWPMATLGLVLGLLLEASALGALRVPDPGVYIAGLTWLVVVAMLQLLVQIVTTLDAD